MCFGLPTAVRGSYKLLEDHYVLKDTKSRDIQATRPVKGNVKY
jgi:hypothetical protein